MKRIQIASPLFILREACARDLFGVLERLAALGFDGVEFLGFFGHEAAEVREKLDALGLRALGNHVPYGELADDPDRVLDFHRQAGCSYLTVAELPEGSLGPLVRELEKLAGLAARRDIRLLYHNHARELVRTRDGQRELDAILAAVPSSVMALEPDLGWMEIGGGNPAEYLARYRERCPVIHLKDYYAEGGMLGDIQDRIPQRGDRAMGCFEFRPVGYGVLNLARLMPLCLACRPQWLVMDHDMAYDRDPYADLKISLDYTRGLLAMEASGAYSV